MSTSFSVRVVNSNGNPMRSIRVYADFGILSGGITEYTDDNGWAEFNASGNYVSVELFVDGNSYGDYGVSDGETFSFTLD